MPERPKQPDFDELPYENLTEEDIVIINVCPSYVKVHVPKLGKVLLINVSALGKLAGAWQRKCDQYKLKLKDYYPRDET
ncbi:MAG: hypothetical protein HYW89_01160 [Candidatus Sungiibacteriota bacterium]|uniref:Uncharacterized protein n=1 Tax=Candidatus Sungiibacteriota bacterium TaxID=2750080 RepID=A0A7T5RJY5_9BACT|nr:MAG: hypothetical protein HYW89_01160 [Candidatus Sungbacteria bacterium]